MEDIMIVLSVNKVSLSFGTTNILENITFNIQESDKVGLIGVNGAGKSSLFKIIAGILQPDSGEIFQAKDLKIGYLEQNSGLDSSRSIWDELISIFSELIEIETRLKQLEKAMGSEHQESMLSGFMKEYDRLIEKYSRNGGYEYTSKTKGILKGLGFNEDEFSLKIDTLSGGQKTRLALARLLLEEPDMLFLDEPTNHLDIDTLEWLEEFLKNYRKSVLVISHDRYFLDKVTNKTLELENCKCRMYNGNYSAFMKQKAVDREIQQKHYELQQKEIAKMEAFIEQQKRWNRERNIVAAESRQKAIDRLDKIEKPEKLPEKIKIKFRSEIISGNDVLFVEGLSKEYPGKPLFTDVNFNIKKNERVFLLGPNGCGKTTLLKILDGRIEQTSGCVEYGHNIKVGYYDQELKDLDENNIIIDEVWSVNDKLARADVRNALASFLFRGEDVFKRISTLSGGEKSRIALVKLMLSGANFLLLDEPTNHLDVNSRESLEEALLNFDGTILAVSHDRYFISKLGTRILEFNGKSIFDFKADYSHYLEYRNRIKKTLQHEGKLTRKVSASKIEHMESKEEKARKRKLEKRLNETEHEIEEVENRLETISHEMERKDIQSDHIKLLDFHNEYNKLNKRLEELYNIWESLAEEKEKNDTEPGF
jgi:ATP-binding cassette subfamily F protein 3